MSLVFNVLIDGCACLCQKFDEMPLDLTSKCPQSKSVDARPRVCTRGRSPLAPYHIHTCHTHTTPCTYIRTHYTSLLVTPCTYIHVTLYMYMCADLHTSRLVRVWSVHHTLFVYVVRAPHTHHVRSHSSPNRSTLSPRWSTGCYPRLLGYLSVR